MIFSNKLSKSHSALDVDSSQDCHIRTHNLCFSLTVVYTTIEATLAALRRAAEMAVELEAEIRILIPQSVPYSLPLDRPPVDPAFRVRRFLTKLENETLETHIDVRLCRDVSCCLLESLLPQSLVLIGTDRRFWFAREKQWKKTLERAGHQVIMIYERKNKLTSPQ